jgi:hypothetical protein
MKRWGHPVLEVLSMSPPPFDVAASTVNAAWYAIERDYRMAGLSLAAAVPLLDFIKLAKNFKIAKGAAAAGRGGEAASRAEKAATDAAAVAKRAAAWRPKPWRDCGAAGPGGLSLRFGTGWTEAQRSAADEKVKALFEASRRGELKKTLAQRAGTASPRYERSGVSDGDDVDHIIDLQLGGKDDALNLKPLDRTVNRSLGKQVQLQLSALPVGHMISTVAIC